MLDRIEVNLLPAEYRVHAPQLRLKREIVYPLLGIIVVSVFMLLWFIKITNDIREYSVKIDNIQSEIQNNKHIKDEIDNLEEEKKVIEGKIEALERINVNRGKWVRLQEIFCQCLPDQTWLNSIAEVEDRLQIQGVTYSFPEVASFMSGLSESEFISGVDLEKIEQFESKAQMFNFTLNCGINSDVLLNSRMAGSE